MAAWTLGALIRVWVPLWQDCLLGIFIVAVPTLLQQRVGRPLQPIADAAIVGSTAILSVLPVDPVRVAIAVVAFTGAGFAMDAVTRRLSERERKLLLASPLALVLLLILTVGQEDDFGSRLLRQDHSFPLRMALAAPFPGERVELPSGAVGWLLQDPARARGIAILLHGNNPGASAQPAAIAMQGALLRAGYDTMTVDHPGYGASPLPPLTASWQAWDPVIGPREALAYLRTTRPQLTGDTLIIGHSMGADVALQWLKEQPPVENVWLFAGAITRPPASAQDRDDYVRLFHQERNILCCIPATLMNAVNEHFYASAEHYAAQIPESHPPIHFVRFGIEYPDVAVDREPLYSAISPPKTAAELPLTTHYLNTLELRKLALVDTRVVTRAASLLRPALSEP